MSWLTPPRTISHANGSKSPSGMFSRADECPSDRYWITTSRAGERNIKERDGPGGATPNAAAQPRLEGVGCSRWLGRQPHALSRSPARLLPVDENVLLRRPVGGPRVINKCPLIFREGFERL